MSSHLPSMKEPQLKLSHLTTESTLLTSRSHVRPGALLYTQGLGGLPDPHPLYLMLGSDEGHRPVLAHRVILGKNERMNR